MDVILLERVEKLGPMGQIVKVRPGYARNFLIPQGKALRATKRALATFETQRTQLEADNLKRREDALGLKEAIEGRGVVIIRQASETKQLYGSVSARDIAEAFTADGITLDRRQVGLADPIKTLGIYDIRVWLHPEVDTTLHINVARSPEEAEIQAGRATPPSDEDEAEVGDELDQGVEASPGFADIIELELEEAAMQR